MIGPDVWGPHGWKFIHYVTLGYPNNPSDDIKEKYRNFFLLLQYVLPCSICAHHYAENITNLPLTDEILDKRDNLIRWAIDIHNIVNESKGKKIVSYKDALNMINTDEKCFHNVDYETEIKRLNNLVYKLEKENDRSRNKKETNNIYYLLFFFLFLVTIAIVYKKR
jgi:hypothetical protein